MRLIAWKSVLTRSMIQGLLGARLIRCTILLIAVSALVASAQTDHEHVEDRLGGTVTGEMERDTTTCHPQASCNLRVCGRNRWWILLVI